MDLILTSFGLGMSKPERQSPFHRLPPMCMEQDTRRLGLNYGALLMFDRIIIDEATYEALLEPRKSNALWLTPDIERRISGATRDYREFVKQLNTSGRLVTRNFDTSLKQHQDILEAALEYDLRNPMAWVGILEESLRRWDRQMEAIGLRRRQEVSISAPIDSNNEEQFYFLAIAHCLANRYLSVRVLVDVLKRWKSKQEPNLREKARALLRDYLAYVNANIVLSHLYDAPFVDWEDLDPFYKRKFLLAGRREIPGRRHIEQARRLFDVVFPGFFPRDIRVFSRALDDKRIEDLRHLVKDAVEGRVTFDSDFAARTLREVLRQERKAVFRRRITGWLTLPLGLIPVWGTAVQKAAEEAGNALWSSRLLSRHAWFYLVTELDFSEK
jgi:hypothetical protein